MVQSYVEYFSVFFYKMFTKYFPFLQNLHETLFLTKINQTQMKIFLGCLTDFFVVSLLYSSLHPVPRTHCYPLSLNSRKSCEYR